MLKTLTFVNEPISYDGLLRLRQYGFSDAEIKRLHADFTKSGHLQTERAFLAFCVSTKKADHLLTVPTSWQPSSSVLTELAGLGLYESVIEDYLNRFKSVSPTKYHASWDQTFKNLALSLWSSDARNPQCSKATRMHMSWSPTPKVINELLALGYQDNKLSLIQAEYTLYWFERGDMKANWNGHFFWWAKAQFLASSQKR